MEAEKKIKPSLGIDPLEDSDIPYKSKQEEE
jgi:hypothetical protein